MSDAILSTETSSFRYLDATTDPQLLVSSNTNANFEFEFAWNGVDLTDTDDYARFTTMINDITNKTYTFALTNNDQFNLESNSPYPDQSYIAVQSED